MLLVIGGVLLFILAGNSIFGTRREESKNKPQDASGSSAGLVQTDSTGPDAYKVETLALRKLKDKMRDPNNLNTRNLRVPSGSAYLCGEVNANNAFGGKTGFKRFIAGGASAMPTVVEDDGSMKSEQFEEAWQKLC